MVGGEQTALVHLVEADTQGLAVTQHFLGDRVGPVVGEEVVLKEFVMGGDDVFDGGTVLGLLHAQGVDENALVGDGGGDAFEFGQFAAGQCQFFQDGGRVEALGRQVLQWQKGCHSAGSPRSICIEKFHFVYI